MLRIRGLAEQGGWTALLTRPVLRNAALGFCLDHTRRMAGDSRIKCLGRWCCKRFVEMSRSEGCGAVRAAILRCRPPCSRVRCSGLTPLLHGHGAVVLTGASTAGWELQLSALPESQQRSEQRQEKHYQQQNGEKSTQYLIEASFRLEEQQTGDQRAALDSRSVVKKGRTMTFLTSRFQVNCTYFSLSVLRE